MSIIIRAAVSYLVLLFAVRLIGRRVASQLAPFDLVVLFLFAGVTITSILGDDHSSAAMISVVFTLGLMHVLVSWLKTRFAFIGRMVDGTPVVVFERGRWHEHRMRRLRLHEQDVMTAVRQRGLERLAQVRYAVVERDGKISIIAEEA